MNSSFCYNTCVIHAKPPYTLKSQYIFVLDMNIRLIMRKRCGYVNFKYFSGNKTPLLYRFFTCEEEEEILNRTILQFVE